MDLSLAYPMSSLLKTLAPASTLKRFIMFSRGLSVCPKAYRTTTRHNKKYKTEIQKYMTYRTWLNITNMLHHEMVIRDVRPRDMVSVSRPKFEISCLSLSLVLIVSVSSLVVSCLEAFRDLSSICNNLKWLFSSLLDHSYLIHNIAYHF